MIFVLVFAYLLPMCLEAQNTYRAAVYERLDPSNNNMNMTQEDIMLESVGLYEEQAEIAASLGVDILVFPEYGVTGLSVPDSRDGIRPYLQILPWLEPDPIPWNPCLDNGDEFNVTVIKRLSCAASNHSIVLVANFGTLVTCTASNDSTCPDDGVYQFNTDVVFGKNGTVLAVYFKTNLYNEPMFDFPPFPDTHITTFVVDFTTFGLITCFDILWFDPTVLLSQAGIQNLLMPTAWVDGLPFLTSVQSQMAWAMGLNVNVVAANIQRTEDGYRGSGIYSGQTGYLAYIYGPLDHGTLLMADVPSNLSSANNHTQDQYNDIHTGESFNYSGIIYDDLSNYTFQSLNTSYQPKGSAQTGSGSVTCSVQYSFDKPVDSGDYFLAAYQGNITLGGGVYVLSVEVCALMWCKDGDTSQCTRPPVTSSSNLTNLLLTGNFSTQYIYPSILRHNLQLISTTEWSFGKTFVEDGCGDAGCDNTTTSSRVALTETKLDNLREPSTSKIIAELKTGPEFSHRAIVASLYGRSYDKDSH